MRNHTPAALALALAVALVVTAAFAPVADASPYIHAHRGGPLKTVGGELRPAFPENSLPAFRHAAKAGFVLEMDTRLTSDGRAVVMHDASLKRTTTCTGLVSERTLAAIRAECEIDVLGTDDVSRHLGRSDERRAKVPTTIQALSLAREHGVGVNLELNNYPTDPDFDPTSPPSLSEKVARQVEVSGYQPSELIVQSFLPGNLAPFQTDEYFDDTKTSFLTFQSANSIAAAVASGSDIDLISAQWPVDEGIVQDAHAEGLQVAPFTFDRSADVRKATRAGVDALIANDPLSARRAVKRVEPEAAPLPPPPSRRACAATRADNRARPVVNLYPDDSGPRVFALQFKQDLNNIVSYDGFRRKIECMILDYVVPDLSRSRPNVVALTEDVGMMTLATGSRGASTREIFSDPGNVPGCENVPSPCGVAVALGTLDAEYAEQEAAYEDRFDGVPGFSKTFVAGTDTFARGWMQTFSSLAKRYDVYILGSNNQPEFRESVDPTEIELFADPDVRRPTSAFVATGPEVYNEAFMWGPENLTPDGPRPLRNVVASNKKVPLTNIENLISLTPGPSSGPDGIENVRPYRIPGAKAKMSFATSLPAFVYNGGPVTPFGEAPDPGVDPCSDTSKYYMYCLDALGTNLVMQDEANPGEWATSSGWQPLEWMSSTWRSSADPTVSFDYNVTPHMVGNLADLPFDGQTAITQRGLKGPRGVKPSKAKCHYVGNSRFLAEDPDEYEVYAGPKPEFLGLAPWAVDDGPRAELREVGAALAPGSGDPFENNYLETAVIADLPYPPVARRANCSG